MLTTKPFTHQVFNYKNGSHSVKVANHFIHTTDKGIYFQSYNSMVAFIPSDKRKKIVFGRDWDYSRTTTKHLYQFLRDNNIMVHCHKDVENLKRVEFINRNISID